MYFGDPRSNELQLSSRQVERFSFESRKVISFVFTKLRDWLKKLAPLFHPIKSKTKPIVIHSYAFSRALRQLHAITSCFDWFT